MKWSDSMNSEGGERQPNQEMLENSNPWRRLLKKTW